MTDNTIFDVPMYKDLNTNQTVIDVAEYAAEVLANALELGLDTDDERLQEFDPIMKAARVAMAGDGNPTKQIQDYMRRNPNMAGKVLAIFGQEAWSPL